MRQIDTPQEAERYMRDVLMMDAHEYGFQIFSRAYDLEEDKMSSKAMVLADYAGFCLLVDKDGEPDSEFMKWARKTEGLQVEGGSMTLSILTWMSICTSDLGGIFMPKKDHDGKDPRSFSYAVNKMLSNMGLEEGLSRIRKRVIFCDGEQISIQASADHFSRKNSDGKWTSVELGFPTFVDPRLTQYASYSNDPLNSVYVNVDVNLVAEIIKEHGGILQGEVPDMQISTSW